MSHANLIRIDVYAFDGITSFHPATPQMVFSEVARLGIDAACETRALLESTDWGMDQIADA
jgi:hypothetical protein